MNARQKIFLEDAIIAVGLLLAGSYLYLFAAADALQDHMVDGPLKAYTSGSGIHIELRPFPWGWESPWPS